MPRVRRRWTSEEDSVLKKAVTAVMEQSRPIMWRELAKQVPGRSNKDCRRRWWNTLGGGTAKGLWLEEEDKLLTEAVSKHGTDWRRVARDVVSQTPDQCSSHWSQVLDPEINHCDWTGSEDERLLHEVLTNSINWSVIATTHNPRRTTLSLKNRYATLRLRHEKNANGKQSPQEPGESSQDLMDQADDDEDRGDSGQNDESGDEYNYDDIPDLPPITGSSSSYSSMLPATPLDWMDVFNQTGEVPSAPLTSTVVPGGGLVTHFDLGAISEEMGNRPLLESYGDPVDPVDGILTDKSMMGTGTSSSKSTITSDSSTYQVSADLICNGSQLEGIIRTVIQTGAVLNVQIKPR
ncbi:Myb-related protein B [Penicillium digitatum]|uniref:Myb-related protein B n=1 Tax=Penicillium digitatum TaxID=36651 RepID=A0A7T6XU56_PENDI|nr:Myb-related protein B [Penicillium digitatum]